jgi:hypothetical protein
MKSNKTNLMKQIALKELANVQEEIQTQIPLKMYKVSSAEQLYEVIVVVKLSCP